MNATLPTRHLESRVRVAHGRNRESQIANALNTQCGLNLTDATDADDKIHKIDRWLNRNGQRIPLQIKYRETGDDLLFEVFDTFDGWDAPTNKVGRDMKGNARLYAVLRSDCRTVNIIEVQNAKKIIDTLLMLAKQMGWSESDGMFHTFRFRVNGQTAELKVQRDPGDGRSKMIAYIPSAALATNAETHTVTMPKNWK